MAPRFEQQFLTEAARVFKDPDPGRFKESTVEDLSYFISEIQADESRKKSRVTPLIFAVEAQCLASRRKSTQLTKHFVESYLHWLQWDDKREARIEKNDLRNKRKDVRGEQIRRMRQRGIFYSSRDTDDVKSARDTVLNHVKEIVKHRIAAGARKHTENAIAKVWNARKIRVSQGLSETTKNWPHRNTYHTLDYPRSLEEAVLSNEQNREEGNNPLTTKFPMIFPVSPDLSVLTDCTQHPHTRKFTLVQNSFALSFMKGVAGKNQHRGGVEFFGFEKQLKLALKAFSLADPPKMLKQRLENSVSLYLQEWRKRVKYHLNAPSVSTERFSLYEENPTAPGYFAATDVTTVFNPAMLFKKAQEKENLYKSMAEESGNILGKRLAHANWLRSAAKDVRLTDLQEWLPLRPQSGLEWPTDKRREKWVNGPPYFGNAAFQKQSILENDLAVCRIKNVQFLAGFMAEYVTQRNVSHKLVLKDEMQLSTPDFYHSKPPWLGLLDASDIEKMAARFVKKV